MKKLLIKFALFLIRMCEKNKNTEISSGIADSEIECVANGHIWSSPFKLKSNVDSDKELDKPIKDRAYCKRCKKIYSQANYK